MTHSIHSAAQDHAIQTLADALIDDNPYSHAVVNRLFPEAYYEKLLASLPKLEEYDLVPQAEAYESWCRQRLGEPGQRRHLWLVDLLSQKRGPLSTFWHDFAQTFGSRLFATSVAGIFLDRTLGSTADVAVRFVQEIGAACIAPHIDMPHKVISVICYLGTAGEASSSQGTALYKQDANGVAVVEKRIPFVSNDALVIPRTEESLHGVEPHRLTSPRLTLHFYIQDGDEHRRGVVAA